MKVGVLSDTHCGFQESLPVEVVQRLSEADLILHAGDICFQGVLDELSTTAPVRAVQGNMDPADLGLPPKIVITENGVSVGLIHGYGVPDGIEERIRREFDAVQVIVYGHTHRACCHTTDNVLFFNPGSACLPKDGERASVGFLTITDDGDVRGEIVYVYP